jgi:uncharacterized protein YkwD
MSALVQNEALTKIARIKAEEMAKDSLKTLEFPLGVKKFLKENNIETFAQTYFFSIGKKTPDTIVNEWKKQSNFERDTWGKDKTTEIGVGAAQAANGDMYYVCINICPFGEKEKTALEDEVIRLVNAERKKAGLSPVTKNDDLMKVARMKADDMTNNGYCAHESPTYGSPKNMVEKYTTGITFLGENITAGQPTAAEAVTAWVISPAHNDIILKKSANIVGIGVSLNEKGNLIWSLLMAKN